MQKNIQRFSFLYTICCVTMVFLACSLMLPDMGYAKAVKKEKKHGLVGKASWYGDKFHGRLTASGVAYNMYTQTAAHRTLPFGTVVEVVDASSKKSTIVCITDRGPFVRGRVIDLSKTAADELSIGSKGLVSVKLRVVTDAHGKTLNANEAFFVQIHSDLSKKSEQIGPYVQFADAAVMREVFSSVHPDASIVVEKIN